MATSTDMRVRISADLADIKQGLGLLRGELAKVKSDSAKAFGAGGSNALVGSIRRLRTEFMGLVGAYASLAGGKLLAGLADEATQIRGRIRAAKGDYQAILAIAQQTRSGLAATTDLYARMERSTRSLGVSQERLLGLTQSINQAIRLSYTSTAAGEAAVMQFGQALAAGELRGQELNSVLEQTSRLAEAVAAGMGIQVGELKALAKEGKLTAEQVLRAVETQAANLAKEFSEMPLTIGDAFTQIRNSFVDFIGNADQATGASARFVQALQGVAANMPTLLAPLLNAVTLLIQNFDALVVLVGTRFALAAIPAAITAATQLRAMFIALRAATITWSTALAALGGPAGIALAAVAAALYVVYTRTNQAAEAAKEHERALADNANMATVSAGEALREAQAKRIQAAATLQAARAALEERRSRFAVENQSMTARGGDRGDAAAFASTTALNRQRAAVAQAEKVYDDWGKRLAKLAVDMAIPLDVPAVKLGAVATATDKAARTAKASGEKAKEAVRGIADAMVLALDAAERELERLEEQFRDGNIKAADYFRQRVALEEQIIDIKIRQQQAEAATASSSDQQSRALTEIVKLQRDRLEIGPRAAREQAKAEKEAAAATLEALRAKQQQVMEQLRGGTDYINAQSQLGALGPVEAERQLFDLRAKSLKQLRALRQAMADYLATTAPDSPEHTAAVAGLQGLDTEIAQVQTAQQTLRNQMKDQALQSLTTFFTDLSSGAKSFKDAFLDMVRSFVAGIAQMMAQRLAAQVVKGIFGAFAGGSAKGNIFGPSGLQAFAKGAAFALPGVMAFANGGAFTNSLVDSPTLFSFGRGGQFGVMGEAGPEAVMPLMRGRDGRLGVQAHGAAAPQRTNVVVVFSEDDLADALSGAAGERVVVAHARNNRRAIGS